MYLHIGMIQIGKKHRGLMDKTMNMYIFIWQNTDKLLSEKLLTLKFLFLKLEFRKFCLSLLIVFGHIDTCLCIFLYFICFVV